MNREIWLSIPECVLLETLKTLEQLPRRSEADLQERVEIIPSQSTTT